MPPWVLTLRPSRQLLALLAVGHCLAAGAILSLALPWEAQAGLLAALAISGIVSFGRVHRSPLAELHFHVDGSCEVVTKSGSRETARILPELAIFPGLMVLRLEVAGRRIPLVLLPDSAEADALRRLRIWLRCRSSQLSASA
jgi:toxin CptA